MKSVCAFLLLGMVAAAWPGDAPKLTWADCVTPALQSGKFACGVLEVPESWGSAATESVTLPFAIRRAKSPHPDSVAFLIGGPGGTNIGYVPLIAPSFDTIDRDIVFLERRGAGFSQPSLTCSAELSREKLTDLEGIKRCADTLRAQNVDLDAFGTTAAARDLEALRKLLGVRQWDLFGASYGTAHALEVMREFPQSVRVAVLDSPLPPGADPFSEQTAHRLSSLSQVFDTCSNERECAAKFPHLRERFLQAVSSLDAQPLEVDGMRLDGAMLLQFAVDALESSYTVQRLPLAIHASATRDVKLLQSVIAPPAGSEAAVAIVPPEKSRIALGLWLSVECSERAAFARAAPADSCKDWPAGVCQRLDSQLMDLRKACEVWPAKRASPRIQEPVTSDIPTLIFTGEFDPVTPTVWGHLAAKTLKNSRVLSVPGAGHTVAQEPCPMTIIRALYENALIPTDFSCLDAPRPPFLTGLD